MDFSKLTVKEALKNEKIVALIKQYAPEVLGNPALKLMSNKTVPYVLDFAQKKNLITKEQAADIEAEIKKALGE